MVKPLVSIITPTYNHELFIRDCIESVQSQTFGEWEQIIIDDGSSDSTPEILRKIRDPRIRVFFQNHKGIYKLNETYNFALSEARGEIIAILEGDDKWPIEKLSKQFDLFRDPKTIFSWGKGIIIDKGGQFLSYTSTVETKKEIVEFSNFQALGFLLDFDLFTPTSTVMVRKSALKEIGGFKQPKDVLFVDYPTWLALCAKVSGNFTFMNEILGFWRESPKQITSSQKQKMYFSHYSTIFNFLCETQICLEKIFKNEKISHLKNLSLGEINLFQKNWKGARYAFGVAIKNKPKRGNFLKPLLGYLSCLIHFDLLNLFRSLKRKTPFKWSHKILKIE